MCQHVGVNTSAGTHRSQKHWIPGGGLSADQCGCWEPNTGPLEEKPTLLITESSFQLLSGFVVGVFYTGAGQELGALVLQISTSGGHQSHLTALAQATKHHAGMWGSRSMVEIKTSTF